jgi:lipid A 3-O-deacylase
MYYNDRVRWYWSLGPLVLVAGVLATVPALADGDGILTDLKLGVLDHDVPILGGHTEHGVDINAELQFQSFVPESAVGGIDPRLRWLLRPAPNIGVDGNTAGLTSQLYFGLIWTVNLDNGGVLWPNHAVFFSFGFGGAANNGKIYAPDTSDHLSLGANLLFHEQLELGYRITPRWSVSVYFDHSSNAHIDRYNAGLDNLGVRVGLHF